MAVIRESGRPGTVWCAWKIVGMRSTTTQRPIMLTLCMLDYMNGPLSSTDFFIMYAFTYTMTVSNSLDLDQARPFIRPDLDPKCLQRLHADDKTR